MLKDVGMISTWSSTADTNPLDVPPLCCRASQAEADHVHEQTGDPQQVHGVTNECGRNDIVHKEGSIVRKEHAPKRHIKMEVIVAKD